FFFQAEDGIRDFHVTGVQTCALPISEGWAPDSWRARPALQQPAYPDAAALAGTLRELRELPPLVTSWEILALRRQLADAQEGRQIGRASCRERVKRTDADESEKEQES